MARAVSGDTPGSSLIVDIGSRATNLVLVRDGDVRLNRSLNTGGMRSPQRSRRVRRWERAGRMKCGTKDF